MTKHCGRQYVRQYVRGDFYSENVVFSMKIPGNTEQWDITETNYWIRLLIFDDNSSFLFSKPVPMS